MALGFRLWFGLGLGLGDRFEAGEDFVPEMWGERCRARGFPGLLPGRWGRPCSCRGVSGRQVCGCSFGFGRGLVDEVGGEGRGGGGGR